MSAFGRWGYSVFGAGVDAGPSGPSAADEWFYNAWRSAGTLNSSAGNITLERPPTTASPIVDGDLIIAAIAYRGNAPFAAPSGWNVAVNEYASANATYPGTAALLVAWFIVDGADPSYAFTRTGGDVATAATFAYRAGNGVPTLKAASSALMPGSGTLATAPGLTTAASNSLLIMFRGRGRDDGGTMNPRAVTDPTAYNNTETAPSTTALAANLWVRRWRYGNSSGAGAQLYVADAVKSTAGATGEFQSDGGSSSRDVLAVLEFNL